EQPLPVRHPAVDGPAGRRGGERLTAHHPDAARRGAAHRGGSSGNGARRLAPAAAARRSQTPLSCWQGRFDCAILPDAFPTILTNFVGFGRSLATRSIISVQGDHRVKDRNESTTCRSYWPCTESDRR